MRHEDHRWRTPEVLIRLVQVPQTALHERITQKKPTSGELLLRAISELVLSLNASQEDRTGSDDAFGCSSCVGLRPNTEQNRHQFLNVECLCCL